MMSSLLQPEWASQNYPKPRTTTAEWLHKATDRNVSCSSPHLYMYMSTNKTVGVGIR